MEALMHPYRDPAHRRDDREDDELAPVELDATPLAAFGVTWFLAVLVAFVFGCTFSGCLGVGACALMMGKILDEVAS